MIFKTKVSQICLMLAMNLNLIMYFLLNTKFTNELNYDLNYYLRKNLLNLTTNKSKLKTKNFCGNSL
jgi:hypothetical protein